jgi:hypothetical protein
MPGANPSRAAYSAAWSSFGRHRTQASVHGDSVPRQPLSSRWPLRHRLIRRHRSGASRGRATGCPSASPTRTSGGMSCRTVFVQRTGRPNRRTRQCRARCWPQRLSGVRRVFIAAADWLPHSGLLCQGEARVVGVLAEPSSIDGVGVSVVGVAGHGGRARAGGRSARAERGRRSRRLTDPIGALCGLISACLIVDV